MHVWIRLPLLIIAAAVAGVVSVVGPYLATYDDSIVSPNSLPPYRLLGHAWEFGPLVPTVLLLLLTAAALGYLNPRHRLLVGLFAVLPFPVAAIVEMSIHPTSHNLWPIEFVSYALFIAVPALIGAAVGAAIKQRPSGAT